MMLEIQTFDYVVKGEDGKIIGKYTSTDEPPMKGDIIDLSKLPDWEAAEVLGVTMMLTKHDNTVVLKVRPARKLLIESLNREGRFFSLGMGLSEAPRRLAGNRRSHSR